MPAQWDESRAVGRHQEVLTLPVSVDSARLYGMVGLSAQEYGLELIRFAESAAKRWHVVQITSFHPIHVAMDQSHPRDSRKALEPGLEGVAGAGCRFACLESRPRCFRARAAVRLPTWERGSESETVGLRADAPIEGLTPFLPDAVVEVGDSGIGQLLSM